LWLRLGFRLDLIIFQSLRLAEFEGGWGDLHSRRSPITHYCHPPPNEFPFYLPYNSKLVDRAKQMRRNPTPAEQKLWEEYLKTFPHRVLRQRPIEHFIVDFYCAALRLVIEIDGAVHLSKSAQTYDAERTIELEKYGLLIIRFANDKVMNNFEDVCKQIAA
jgi:very-short-patch-repair endonuclease